MKNKTLPSGTDKYTEVRLKPLAMAIAKIVAGSMMMTILVMSRHAYAGTPLPLPKPAAVWNQLQQSATGVSQFQLGNTTATFSGNNLDVTQRDDRVVLPWDSFDIDTGHKVEFFQPSASSIALNRINEQVNPSQILGTLKANGQIYLINKNGFVFGNNAVVDVNSLVASSLYISDEVFAGSITQVYNDSFGQVAALEGSGEIYLRDIDGNVLLDEQGQRIKIQIMIEQGAQIRAQQNGRVLLVAPSVTNAGTIETTDGQTLLVGATDKVYLRDAGINDTGIRGLLVEVETGGEVNNLGTILSERGNTTLLGFAVNQSGLISATTSVRLNGSVRLLARESLASRISEGKNIRLAAVSTTRNVDLDDGLGLKATVTFGANSITEVKPEIDDPRTGVAGQTNALKPSIIEAVAQTVHVKSGALLSAKSGEINLTATEHPLAPDTKDVPKNASRILLEAGSVIDVSGLRDIVKSMESNIVEVDLRGSDQLSDAPLQKGGILEGKKVRIDLREGSPLIADMDKLRDSVARTIAEVSTEAGNIKLVSEGDVIHSQGAQLDVSGGSVDVQGGIVETTRLLSSGLNLDISEADPNLQYDSVLGEVTQEYTKWGVTKTWSVPGPVSFGRFESGYTEGKSAGKVTISAHALVLDGDIRADEVIGRRQRQVNDRPAGGRLAIDLTRSNQSIQRLEFQNNKIVHSIGIDDLFPVDSEDARAATPLVISSEFLRSSGIQHLDIKTGGRADIIAGTHIEMPEAGSFNVTAATINVDGSITSAGGSVALVSKFDVQALVRPASQGVRVGSDAIIQTSGNWTNDNPLIVSGVPTGTVALDGGNIKLEAQVVGDVVLEQGSVVDASGGAWIQQDGNFSGGDGGDISIITKADNGSILQLDGTLKSAGFANGGTLTLGANSFVIGKDAGSPVAEGLNPVVLAPEFFKTGGFSAYKLDANFGGIVVADNTRLHLQQQNLQLAGNFSLSPSNNSAASVAEIVTQPDFLRNAVDLELKVSQNISDDALIKVGKGSVIDAEVGANITLASETSIHVDGVIRAPAGNISMRIDKPSNERAYIDNQGIWISDTAVLDVSGAVVDRPDSAGFNRSTVLGGGSVNFLADRGFVAITEGAVIDVSGTQADTLTEVNTGRLGTRLETQRIASHAGELSISAADGAYVAGTLNAHGGDGAGTAGGSLNLELDPELRIFNPDDLGTNVPFPEGPHVVHVYGRDVVAIPVDPLTGKPVEPGGAIPESAQAQAIIDVNTIEGGGFDRVRLVSSDEIRFHGDVSLKVEDSILLDAPVIGWTADDSESNTAVNMGASYVGIGYTKQPVITDAVHGSGQFTVQANLIDMIGFSSFQGFGSVDLQSQGDIRLRGIRRPADRDFTGGLNVANELRLQAEQVYPTTLTKFTASVGMDVDTDNDGVADARRGLLRVEKIGDNRPVLSAAGQLTLEAPEIQQHGRIKAPFGNIAFKAEYNLELGADSLTSVSGEGQIIPLGQTQGELDWLYQVGNQNLIFDAPPNKRIELDGRNVAVLQGAVVDISGSGDLQAWEFEPGPGGSTDVLDTSAAYAVLPGLGSGYAPIDPNDFKVSGLQVGDSIYLEGNDLLPAGRYALLPARYALLPGAVLITPQMSEGAFLPGQTSHRIDGASVVAGYYTRSGTSNRDSLWSGFVVEPGSVVRTRATYKVNRANEFYATRAVAEETAIPVRPVDAGQLSITPTASLVLEGELRAAASNGGRGSQVDIAAEKLAVVNRRTPVADRGESATVELLADDINRLGAESLLLGGTRDINGDEEVIEVIATSVTITPNRDPADANDQSTVELSLPEITIVAHENVTLEDGARVSVSGVTGSAMKVLKLQGDSAVLRVSSADQVNVVHSDEANEKGVVDIQSGASVAASSSSMLIDASRDTRIEGTLEIDGGSLNMGAGRISIGNVPTGTTGLLLDELTIANLAADELVLTSRSSIDFYGSANLDLNRLTLDSANVRGFGEATDVTKISVARFTLENLASVEPSVDDSAGDGHLKVDAKQLVLADGDYSISGFNNIELAASEDLTFSGEGKLTIGSDAVINAALLQGRAGSFREIRADGRALTIGGAGRVIDEALAGLGARLSLKAADLAIDSRILLRSGSLEARVTTGDVLFGANADINVAGSTIDMIETEFAVAAGKITATSEQGDVRFANGSRLDLSVTSNEVSAGELEVSAVNGSVDFSGTINASGGSIDLDVNQLDSSGLDVLNTYIAQSGFNNTIAVRQRSGDLILNANNNMLAHNVTLTADSGGVTIAGNIDASGSDGGVVNLNADDDVRITNTGSVDASATSDNAEGGKVALTTLDADNDGLGQVRVEGTIDVSGGASGRGGEVALVARRTADDADVEVAPITGTILGAREVSVDAVKIYENVNEVNNTGGGPGVLGFDDVVTNLAAFMTHADIIRQRLGQDVAIRPVVEARSTGDMTIIDDLDFSDTARWRFNGVSGVMRLRAAGNLNIEANISDGITSKLFGRSFIDVPQSIESWGFDLIAGADIDSADVYAVVDGIGDLTLGNADASNGNSVRTGTGDIAMVSGGNIVFTHTDSSVYTLGRQTVENPYGSFDSLTAQAFYAEFPIDGGDITIHAGGDFRSQPGGQFISDWLRRVSSWDENTLKGVPTFWGINLPSGTGGPGSFGMGVGLLAGGNALIDVGGDMVDVSVVIPTTARQIGENLTPPNNRNRNAISFAENRFEIQGGGDFDINVGGDVKGGIFYAARGKGQLHAGGGLVRDDRLANNLFPVFALGDSSIDVTANQGIGVGAVIDPMVVKGGDSLFSFIHSYSGNSAIKLTSLGGDVRLENDVATVKNAYHLTLSTDKAVSVYPASLQVQSASGSIKIDNGFTLFPSPLGQLSLLAAQDIVSGQKSTKSTKSDVSILFSDADPTLLPNAQNPLKGYADAVARLNPGGSAQLIHARTPMHTDDTIPVYLIARDGDLKSGSKIMSFDLAKSAVIRSGRDIKDITLRLQNINSNDVTRVQAGRDIEFTLGRDQSGNLQGADNFEYVVGGPGLLQVLAGRNIDLGSSRGISTVGDQKNTALADTGADVLVMAGLNNRADYDNFFDQYFVNSDEYDPLLLEKMQLFTGKSGLDKVAALAEYAGLLDQDKRSLVFPAFFTELLASGKAAADGVPDGYNRGLEAGDRLFPDASAGGDLSLFFSKIHTLDGGDINLVVPGGLVNAGLSVSFESRPASDLGIVAQRSGNINTFSRDDFIVNTSRVFALGGGDILMWSAEGDIDAGRGAKSSLSIPPPEVSIDEKGNLQVEFPAAVSGAGIRTASSDENIEPGDVTLVAPTGIVNAGDAGIGGNNITIAATEVLGADNIDIGGVSVGVPVGDTASLAAGLTGVSSLSSSASNMAEESAGSLGANANQGNALSDSVAGFLSIELVGFGD